MHKQQVTFFGMVVFLCLNFDSFGQFSVASYLTSFTRTSVAYDISHKLTPELRLYNQELDDNPSLDILLLYKFARNDQYNFYTGLGVTEYRTSRLAVPIGFQFRPIEKMPNVSVIFELMSLYDNDVSFQNSFGVKYRFGT